MLEKLCNHVHNYFVRSAYPDTYTIENGALALSFLKDGQRFRVMGSDLNDGVYTWHANAINNDDNDDPAALKDETFDGVILTMSVPTEFEALAQEVSAWVAQYGEKVMSPYQSENVIGVYSYTKAETSKADGSTASPTWESAFASRLAPYRRTGDLL